MSEDPVAGFARRWADVWRRAWEAGFDMFLLKPVDPAELRELVLVVGST